MGWATTGHQACLAHLLRDVQYAIEAGDLAFAPGLKKLLKQAVAIGRRRDRLADSTLGFYAARLETRLDGLLALAPASEPGRKVQRIIKKYRQNLFVFMTNRAIPPTNNGRNGRCDPASSTARSPTASALEWGPASAATSGRCSKPPDDEASRSSARSS